MKESDASSFLIAGSRATYMVRDYSAWEPTSPVFAKEGTTIFVSCTSETLDKKLPLLRSMNATEKKGKRILALFAKKAKSFR